MNVSNETSTKDDGPAHSLMYAPFEVTIIYITINLFVIIVNTFHLILLHRTDLFNFSNRHKFFLKLLAVVDLLLGVFRLAFTNQGVQQAFVDHVWLCVLSQVIVQGLMISSFGLVLLASVDRLLATTQDYAENYFVVHYRKFNFLFCAIVFTIYGGIAIVWHDTGAYKMKGIACCDIQRKERITLLFAWLVLFLTVVVYVILLHWMRGKPTVVVTPSIAKRRTRTVRTLGYLVLVHLFLISVTTTSVFVKNLPFWTWFRYICACSLTLNALVDPLVYGVGTREGLQKEGYQYSIYLNIL